METVMALGRRNGDRGIILGVSFVETADSRQLADVFISFSHKRPFDLQTGGSQLNLWPKKKLLLLPRSVTAIYRSEGGCSSAKTPKSQPMSRVRYRQQDYQSPKRRIFRPKPRQPAVRKRSPSVLQACCVSRGVHP